jgi:rubrerythrin
MDDILKIDEIDADGAIREAAEEVATDTRLGFLRKAAVGGAVVVGGSAFMGAMPKIASAAGIPASDIAILNFALTLEYLEAAFYAEAVANGKLTDKDTKRFATVVASHEDQHVKFLQAVLKSKAVARPKFDFKGTTADEAKFQATADVLENTGVHAYLGQVPNIKAKPVLIGAGRILPIEARHAAWIRDIRFQGGTTSPETPAPGAFEDGFSKAKILAAVKATGFIVV